MIRRGKQTRKHGLDPADWLDASSGSHARGEQGNKVRLHAGDLFHRGRTAAAKGEHLGKDTRVGDVLIAGPIVGNIVEAKHVTKCVEKRRRVQSKGLGKRPVDVEHD